MYKMCSMTCTVREHQGICSVIQVLHAHEAVYRLTHTGPYIRKDFIMLPLSDFFLGALSDGQNVLKKIRHGGMHGYSNGLNLRIPPGQAQSESHWVILLRTTLSYGEATSWCITLLRYGTGSLIQRSLLLSCKTSSKILRRHNFLHCQTQHVVKSVLSKQNALSVKAWNKLSRPPRQTRDK